jgi:hypothetical protein
MSTDARTFHALHAFSGLSDEVVRAIDLNGGYATVAASVGNLHNQISYLKAEIAKLQARLAIAKAEAA